MEQQRKVEVRTTKLTTWASEEGNKDRQTDNSFLTVPSVAAVKYSGTVGTEKQRSTVNTRKNTRNQKNTMEAKKTQHESIKNTFDPQVQIVHNLHTILRSLNIVADPNVMGSKYAGTQAICNDHEIYPSCAEFGLLL